MKYQKPPLTTEDCIHLLKLRGLAISDQDRALKYIESIGYFRLTGYMFHLQSKDGDHTFKNATSFEQIINLYQFDKKLRAIVLEYLERLEIYMRAKLTNLYSLSHGFFWYNEQSHYADPTTYEIINEEIRESFKDPKEQFLKAFKNKYTSESLPPSNMALEILSLGKLAKLYKGLKNEQTKIQIATDFDLPSNILTSWLIYLANVRNICAHHSRLWNKKVTVDRPIFPQREKYKLNGSTPLDMNTTMYGITSIIDKLLSSFNPSNNFASKIEALIIEYKINTQLMGFPENWEKEANWKINQQIKPFKNT